MEKAGLAPSRAQRDARRQAARDRKAVRALEADKALARQVDAQMRGEAPYPARDE